MKKACTISYYHYQLRDTLLNVYPVGKRNFHPTHQFMRKEITLVFLLHKLLRGNNYHPELKHYDNSTKVGLTVHHHSTFSDFLIVFLL